MDHVPLFISRFPAPISLRILVMAPAITAATHCRSPKMQDNQESPLNLPQPGTGTIPVPGHWGRCQEWLKATPRSCSHLGTQSREAVLCGACQRQLAFRDKSLLPSMKEQTARGGLSTSPRAGAQAALAGGQG